MRSEQDSGMRRDWGHFGSNSRRQLAEVYHGFTEGFATPDLVEARMLLAEGIGE